MSVEPEEQAIPAGPEGEVLSAPAAGVRRGSRVTITAALMLMMALASMEQTVTSTAMPTIIGELRGLELYAWVIAIYLLAATVVMPLYGRLADVWGRKRVIVLAVALFIGGSILSSLAQTMWQLILFRAVQGLGAGGIMPVVLTILGDIYTIQERARIQGLFSSVWGTASLAGPWLGARLVEHLGWRSVFWVNLPFGVLGLGVLVSFYHDREKPHSTELDLPGIGLLALGSTAVLLFFSVLGQTDAGRQAWIALPVLGVMAAGAFAWFFRHERRTGNPVLSPQLLFHASIGPAVLGSLLLGLCVFSLDTWVPLYVQGGKGGTARDAAATVTPVMFAWAASSFLAAPMVVRWGFRRTSLIGATFIIAGFMGLIGCTLLDAPRWMLTAMLGAAGLGFGPTSISYLLGAQDAVTWQQRGLVTSSITFARTIGGSIGVSVLGAIFNVLIRGELHQLEGKGYSATQLLDPKVHEKLPAEVVGMSQTMIASGLRWVFMLMLLTAICQWVVSRWIPRHRQEQKVTMSEVMEAGV